jgi:hypothetical protein
VTTALFRALAFRRRKAVWRCASHRTPRIRATNIPGIHYEILCASGRGSTAYCRHCRYTVCLNNSVTFLLLLTLLVTLLATGALFFEISFSQPHSLKPAFRIGAPVVYRQQEVSTHPAADACDVHPSERGEYYYYTVINYLRVAEVMADGRIIAVARNNRRLCFRPNDSGLRKARLTERLIYRPRFPHFGDNSSASRSS